VDCFVTMRSVDVALGLPFDITEYALLTHLVASDASATAGVLTMALGDAHVYLNHVQSCEEQLSRRPLPLPTLRLADGAGIDCFEPSMATLLGYAPWPPLAVALNV
jgi:thymidylate synthase